MRYQRIFILISLILALLLMSGGYSIWENELVIKGTIEVVKPEPLVPPENNREQITGQESISESQPDSENSTGAISSDSSIDSSLESSLSNPNGG